MARMGYMDLRAFIATIYWNNMQQLCKAFNQSFPSMQYLMSNRN
ncbi:hypothetical protein RchiOBHm_Chr2g0127901 [Rosa chinensis]|uniref:Uncharacterized protein n=1 Tax=Rosa chinensis TaxID=74649 RepID=A0A2P6RU92_ROSCH|nr:hypothetical protein RchiOBHm_Chr2g0127901 [Rosa chinensis]